MECYVLIRKSISAIRKLIARTMCLSKILFCRLAYTGISISWSANIGRNVLLAATDGGSIKFGRDVSIGRGAQIVAKRGSIVIGDNVVIGVGSIIVCRQSITIEQDTLIAEYVVIRDQDHSVSTRPIRTAGFETEAISIGKDCWLGCKSTILRGSVIGDGSVIGAHALVRGKVDDHSLAVGNPARVVKKLSTP